MEEHRRPFKGWRRRLARRSSGPRTLAVGVGPRCDNSLARRMLRTRNAGFVRAAADRPSLTVFWSFRNLIDQGGGVNLVKTADPCTILTKIKI